MLAQVDTVGGVTGEQVVAQAIDLGVSGKFRKSLVRVPIEQGAIVHVRKRAAVALPGRGAVLLIHGYAQNRYAWHVSRRSLANYLAEAGFDVFNLDLRGNGRSRELGTPRAQAWSEYVEGDLPRAVDAVRALSGEWSVFLVGH